MRDIFIHDTASILSQNIRNGNCQYHRWESYTLISDNGTVYYSLNPEVIHFPPGTSVYWEAVPLDPANHSLGIPVRIMRIAEYVPPLDTVRVNFTINGESAPVPPIATTPPRV